jgi:hypothetical protein
MATRQVQPRAPNPVDGYRHAMRHCRARIDRHGAAAWIGEMRQAKQNYSNPRPANTYMGLSKAASTPAKSGGMGIIARPISRIGDAMIQDDGRRGKQQGLRILSELIIVSARSASGSAQGGPGRLGDRGDALDVIRQKLVDLRPRPRAAHDLDTREDVSRRANFLAAVSA